MLGPHGAASDRRCPFNRAAPLSDDCRMRISNRARVLVLVGVMTVSCSSSPVVHGPNAALAVRFARAWIEDRDLKAADVYVCPGTLGPSEFETIDSSQPQSAFDRIRNAKVADRPIVGPDPRGAVPAHDTRPDFYVPFRATLGSQIVDGSVEVVIGHTRGTLCVRFYDQWIHGLP
jgi:hypothetical protein